MPFVDLQSRLGINVDRWVLTQSGSQPRGKASRCYAFERDWIECSHGIGQTRAKQECKLELEDLYECMFRKKTLSRLNQIKKQKDKMVKEGTYTPPPHHSGQETNPSP